MSDDELRGGAGNTTESGGMPVLVVATGDMDTDVGVFGGGDGGSMVVPTTVVPVSESAGEPVAGRE